MKEAEALQTTEPLETLTIEKKGITGSTLKLIAIGSMLIDHIGAIILERMLVQQGMLEVTSEQAYSIFLDANAGLYYTYIVLRMIGRIAFPIFCFLLVQGFLHTGNLKKYLCRILIFALISELPFDLAFSGKLFQWDYQNVFFTLFFGVLAIAGIRMAEDKKEWNFVWRVLFCLLAIGICIGAAILLKTDYDMLGVLTIVVLYLSRQRKTLSAGLGCVVLMEISAFLSLIPIYLYNGERGRNIKWIFYLFYPVHILFLYLISCALGLGQIILNY